MALRDLDIEIDLDIDSGELRLVNEQIDDLIRNIRRLEDDININVDLNDTGATAELRLLKELVDQLDGRTIDIHVDFGNALSEILILRTQLRLLEFRDIDIRFDTAAAHAQIAALQLQLLMLMNLNRGGGIGGGVSAPGLLGIAGAATKLLAVLLLLPIIATGIQLLVGALGVLGVVIGTVAGGLFALVSALSIAAGGFGIFALTAIPLITKLYDEEAVLTQQQERLKGGIESLRGEWTRLQNAVEYSTFQAIESGIHAIIAGLRIAEPIFNNANRAIGQLFVNLENSLRGNNLTNFFSYLERAIGPLTTNIGNGLGNALQGVLNLFVAFEPLTNFVAQGFENLTERFANFTAGLSQSNGFQNFLSYVQTNLPKIGTIIGQTTVGITNFFAAFGGTASSALDYLVVKVQEFAQYTSELGENQGFQNFLSSIQTSGPQVLALVGQITDKIIGLVDTLAGLGQGENGGLFGFLGRLGDGDTLLQRILPSGQLGTRIVDALTGGSGKVEVPVEPKIDGVSLGAAFDNAYASVSNKEIPLKPNFDALSNGVAALPPLSVPLKAETEQLTSSLGTLAPVPVPLKAEVGQLTQSLGNVPPIAVPLKLDSANSTAGFKFPPYPTFTWPTLPVFKWPELPKFTWPAYRAFVWPPYPVFRWPPIPPVTVNVNATGAVNGSHATGLGRVPFDGYTAELHRDEAVLTADQANSLRSSGMLSGNGASPSLNAAPLNGGAGGSVNIGDINITVEGGNTNEQTGAAVQQALMQWIDTLSDIFPETVEG